MFGRCTTYIYIFQPPGMKRAAAPPAKKNIKIAYKTKLGVA